MDEPGGLYDKKDKDKDIKNKLVVTSGEREVEGKTRIGGLRSTNYYV